MVKKKKRRRKKKKKKKGKADLRRVAYPCLKARKARCLRNTELRAMQRKLGWKLDGSGLKKKINKQQRQLFMRYHHSQPKTG